MHIEKQCPRDNPATSLRMNKIIVITGAGKGIGRAIALEFASRSKAQVSQPCTLVLSSRTPEDLESLAEACRKTGIAVETCRADIANPDDVERLIAFTMERFGRIDCLINNAGVGRFKPLSELTLDDFDYMMSVNARGTFHLSRDVYTIMEKQGSGHIFFITSIAAEMAFTSSTVYSMSKFAQKGLVEALRLYARKSGIRITNVMPGAALTPMWGDVPSSMQEVMMRPEDIATPVVDAWLQPARTVVEELVLRPTGGDITT